MRIRNLLGVMFALATTSVMAENAFVTIQLNDGTKYSYLLADMPKIDYVGDYLRVKGTVNSSFLMNDVDFFHFTESSLSDVPLVTGNELRVSYLDNQHVKVEGLDQNAQAALFSASGACVSLVKANADGVAEFVLPQTGVYVLKTSNQSVKLVKD